LPFTPSDALGFESFGDCEVDCLAGLLAAISAIESEFYRAYKGAASCVACRFVGDITCGQVESSFECSVDRGDSLA
jgi:hypothetical protein